MLVCEHCQQQHSDAHRYCPMTGKIIGPHRFFPSGTVLDGKYRLGRVLGSGGMGAVLVATHVMLNKEMAAKLMLPELSRDREMVARMVREAQAASSTGHRNIALVTDMGWSKLGSLYVIMELLQGQTLTELLRREGPLPISRAVALTRQMLGGLGAVHQRGIVHRDLKPDNLMIVEDDDGGELLKILDFGISKVLDDEEVVLALTNTGMVLGTPFYMSPEQARGARDIDHRADIYAAGGILYTMLTNQRPLQAKEHNAMMAQILEAEIPAPSSLVSQIPSGLDAVVLRALARDRTARYQDVEDFSRALLPFEALGRDPGVEMMPERLELLSLVDLDEQTGAKTDAAKAVSVEPPPVQSPAPATDDSPARPPVQTRDATPRREGSAECSPDELVTLVAPRRRPATAATGTLFEPQQRRASLLVGKIAAVVGVVAVAVVLWLYRAPLLGLLGNDQPPESILLLLQAEPSDAEIYVDGVLQVTNSIQLPRSDREFTVRVSKRGYLSKTLHLTADQTRSLRVVLRRPRR